MVQLLLRPRPQQRRTQAVEDNCFYVNHSIDPKSLDPERTAIFAWESLPLCVPDVEEKNFATHRMRDHGRPDHAAICNPSHEGTGNF